MRKYLITWDYADRAKNDPKCILDASEKKYGKIDEILYLSKGKMDPIYPEIHNIKYEQLKKVSLTYDTDVVKFCKKYFKKENRYIINVSIDDLKEIHIFAFAFFFIEEKYENIIFIKYENSDISELTAEGILEYMDSKCPKFTNLFTTSIYLSFVWMLLRMQKIDIEKQIGVYLGTGFSILLLGERGTGKSLIAKKISEKLEKKMESANCASFADDNSAEAALFGYKGINGLFQNANGGILFLDEIHHLSKAVQAKLMLALNTNQDNKMYVRKLRGLKEYPVEFRLMLATNKTIDELREILLPEFYDRVVQHVIELPPLRDKDNLEKIEQHWEDIWKQLKFKEPAPKEKPLIDWLKKQELRGNYRDLQKIAIYYHTYNLFDEKNKPAKSALDYAKNEFQKYGAKAPEQKIECFSFKAKEIEMKFYFELQKWAIGKYGSKKKAAEELGVEERTLTNWKNKKESNT
jgi:transcriptional regulator with AAA-type ATPase domain